MNVLEPEYRTIPGFENYEVSKRGEVRRVDNHRPMGTFKIGNSTRAVFLSVEGKQHARSIRTLVGMTWGWENV